MTRHGVVVGVAAAVLVATTAVAGAAVTTPTDRTRSRSGSDSHSHRLRLTHVHASKHKLHSHGGHVTIKAHPHHAAHCMLSAKPTVKHLPPKKNCRNRTVKWRVTLPADHRSSTRSFRFSVVAHDGHHDAAKKHLTVLVDPAPAPAIRSTTESVDSLNSDGGKVAIGATVKHAATCALSVTPAILGLPSIHRCGHGSPSWHVVVPPNAVDSAATYQFAFTALGSDGAVAVSTQAVTVAAQSPPCPGQTDTAAPTTEAFFNDPTTGRGATQYTVINAMINAICSASPPVNGKPTTIDLAMYQFELDHVAQALEWAETYRSADVHVALDGENTEVATNNGQILPNQPYDDLVAGLPAGSVVLCGPNAGKVPLPPVDDGQAEQVRAASADSSATVTGTGCAGDNILHTKLLLVSSVDTQRDALVITGSQNTSAHSAEEGFNNGLQLVGSSAVYKADRSYFARLLGNTQDPRLGEELTGASIATSSGLVTNTYYPRNSTDEFPPNDHYHKDNDAATDTTADLLDDVHCSSPGKYAGEHGDGSARTVVQIAVLSFNSRNRVTAQLQALAGKGCIVQVIYANMKASTMSNLKSAGIEPLPINDYNYVFPNGSTGRVFVHDKYLLISGAFGTHGAVAKDQDIVVTGSENLTQLSLHDNDEQVTEVQETATAPVGSTPIFDAYEANYVRLAVVAIGLPPVTEGSAR
jgi:hypothetical protein